MAQRSTCKAVAALLFAALSVSSWTSAGAASPGSSTAIHVEGDVEFTHDPSIIKEGGTWYLFATGAGPSHVGQLPIRCSEDLQHWKRCGQVFDEIPYWIRSQSPATKELWAPDISYFNGEYHLYYAFSVFGKNTSGIALATNKTLNPSSPDFRWTDQGLVLLSKETDNFNAIDPNLIVDPQGRAWLAFGSFWGGIKMRRIDLQSGKLSAQDAKVYSLAARKRPENAAPAPPGLPADWQAIEAPFIVHHSGYYYLFVSYDLCCRGLKSTYKTMVGRSRKITGPYRDADGNRMTEGAAALLLAGNKRWYGPGGESVLLQKDQDIMVFHAYDSTSGHPFLQISTLTWDNDWPHAALEGDAPAAGR